MNEANKQIEKKITNLFEEISLDVNSHEIMVEKHFRNIEWLSIYSDLIANRNIIAPIKYIPVIEIDIMTKALKQILIQKIKYGLCDDVLSNSRLRTFPFPLEDYLSWMGAICENKLLGMYEYSLSKLIVYYKCLSLIANKSNKNTAALDGIIEQLNYWLWEIKERK